MNHTIALFESGESFDDYLSHVNNSVFKSVNHNITVFESCESFDD